MQRSIPAALTEWMGPLAPPQLQRWGAGDPAGGPVILPPTKQVQAEAWEAGIWVQSPSLPPVRGGWEGRGAQSLGSDAEGREAETKPALVAGASRPGRLGPESGQ